MYEIEHNKEDTSTGGVAATSGSAPTMASAAIEHAHSMADPHPPQGSGEPLFTSSDLPLQPYAAGPTPLPPADPIAGVTGGPPYNDLFVNPAFAHMSFLSDGSMVGPNGEIYSPAEYFPSLMVQHSQEVPAVIPVSPQPGDYPSPTAHGPGTPPPSLGKKSERERERERAFMIIKIYL